MLKDKNHHQHKLIKGFKDFDEYIDWRVNKDLHLQKDFFYDILDSLVIDIQNMKKNLLLVLWAYEIFSLRYYS